MVGGTIGEGLSDSVNITITGYSKTEDRRRSEQAGFDQHLVKPVDYNALVSASPLPEQGSRTAD